MSYDDDDDDDNGAARCVQTDVYCFLFTDMFLVTKPATKRGDKVKVIKPPMRLDKIIICGLRDVGRSFSLVVDYLKHH